jgi:diaminopimelate epimerase
MGATTVSGNHTERVVAYHLSGAGNDFLALAEPPRDPAPETVLAWCRRGLSLGADGVLVLRRGDAPGGRSADAATPAVVLTHFNADGSRSDLCVNGSRCAARLAFHLGWADDRLVLHTGAGPLLATPAGAAAVRLVLPAPAAPRRVETVALEGRWSGWRVDAGVPHLVLPWRDGELAAAPLADLGPALRHHRDFAPAGVNVDLVATRSPHRLDLRTWERGVEGETLACGSGVLAAVAAGRAAGELELPVTARTAGGWELEVAVADDDDRWALTGDARLLARLEVEPAAAVPPPR